MMLNVTKLNSYCILTLGLAIAGCSTNKAAPSAKAAAPAAPVSVAQAVSKTVPLEIQAVGNVEAFSTVTVKAQIGGELSQVNFEEGADVKRGDRLFVIDPRPYESQVTQAEANLAKDRAQLQAAQANLARDTAQETYARAQSRRYAELAQQGVLSKDSAEQTNAQATALQEAVRADNAAIESARANIAADQAALDRANLQLEYCTIVSPIDGRTGHLFVKQGNVIKPNDVDLVTINQLRPIYVSFAIPETDLPTIKSHMAHGKVSVAVPFPESGRELLAWRVCAGCGPAERIGGCDRCSRDGRADGAGWDVCICLEVGYDGGSAPRHYGQDFSERDCHSEGFERRRDHRHRRSATACSRKPGSSEIHFSISVTLEGRYERI
ncbi:MAG: hypothetical protein DMG12_06340 [Acidobacteria bacterium]|nr:MAG: hypothetical protein DMG12_06340 [Acidobacteriota bacterium]